MPEFLVQWEAPQPDVFGGGTTWVVDAAAHREMEAKLHAAQARITELEASPALATGLAGEIAELLSAMDGLDRQDRYVEMMRVTKLAEEVGEVAEALIAYHDVNPRKEPGTLDDVIKELADVALLFLGEEPSCGWLLEAGAAIAAGKPVWVVAPFKHTVFWHLPNVTLLTTVSEALGLLDIYDPDRRALHPVNAQ